MCNLYSITTNQAAFTLFGVLNRYVGNPSPIPGVFPDYLVRSFATQGPNARWC